MRDAEVVALIKVDSDKGIRLAIDLYGGLTKAICNNVLRGLNQDEIEEAWSDTFVKLWKYIDGFDLNKNISLKTYVATIARNAALDVRRRNVHSSIYGFTDDMADCVMDITVNIEDDYARLENEKIFREVVDEMSEPDREIFVLRYFFFQPIKKIAQVLNLNAKQVENILFRRKEELKIKLEKRGVLND